MIRYGMIEHWSRNGQIMAMAVAAEAVFAIAIVANAELHRPHMLVVAALVCIASAVLVARTRMPAMAKSVSIAVVCVALLAISAAQEPFGLGEIDQAIEVATHEAPASPAEGEASRSIAGPVASYVSLRATGNASASAFADDLTRESTLKAGAQSGRDRVDGIIGVTAGPSGESYQMTWSIGRAADILWCGRMVAVGQTRGATLESFSTTIAAALRRSRDDTPACF